MKTQENPDEAGHEPAVVDVDAAKIRELADTYVLYRQALIEPGDPVKLLAKTRDVLAAVREVITDPERGIRR